MAEDWIERWDSGRIGWHQAAGNEALQRFWPNVPAGSRVLLPLCGKSPDILWLASRGYAVTGVELSELAIRAFFAESGLDWEVSDVSGLPAYRSSDPDITLVCGDYFAFAGEVFDALYDRGSLVALPPAIRAGYAAHTNAMLRPGAYQLLVTLEYDQSRVAGPPFAVPSDEVRGYWPSLKRVADRDDIDNCPPKFAAAGLTEIEEVVWVAAAD